MNPRRRLLDEQWENRQQPQNDSAANRPFSKGLIERVASHNKEFMQKYRSEAVILREEIQDRLGGTLPKFPTTSIEGTITNNLGNQIFEGPLLSGPHPVAAGADLLEYWAGQLP
jgi:hypothetical protein